MKVNEDKISAAEEEVVVPVSRFIFANIFIDSVCYTGLIFIILFSYTMWLDTANLHVEVLQKYKPKDYVIPKASDLYPAFLYLVILYLLNKFCFYIFGKFVERNLSLSIVEESNPSLNDIYIYKTCNSIFKFFFYFFSTILGYYTLKDADFLPTNFFGKGEFINIYKDPFPAHYFFDKPKHMDLFINIGLAYSYFDFLELLINPYQTDFLFMVIHHLSTISLIVFSTYASYSHVGGTVMFLHFYGDIYSYVVRSIIYLNVKDIWRAITTFIFLVNFSFTRTYILSGWLSAIYKGIKHEWRFFEWWLYVFLYILLSLHLLWIFMIGKKLVQYLTTGNVADIYKIKNKQKSK